MKIRQTMKRYRPQLIALLAAGALVACGGGSTGSGGTGGTAGAGGTGGMGGAAGMGGTAGAGGTGGTGGTNSPPEATIVAPASDSGTDNPDYVYDGFDSTLNLWYLDVTLEGLGTDAEDGTLTGAALVWKTNQTGVQNEVLGTGVNLTVRLYSDVCTGIEHVIQLEVTDSNGQTTTSLPRTLLIWTLC